jgi:formate transporter
VSQRSTSDAYSPQEITSRVEEFGVAKANAPFLQTFMLGAMAGGFIGLGGLFHTLILSDSTLSPATGRILGGIFFASGYLITILAGAEAFTSNNLLAMAFASGKISLRQTLRNWGIVLFANAVGAIGLVILFLISGLHQLLDGAVGEMAYLIGARKGDQTFLEDFARGVLGNLFVCIAVWISLGGRSVADKVLGVIFPLTALGALSLEHVVASLYYIPRSLLIAIFFPEYVPENGPVITYSIFFDHFVPVIAGNIFGGSVMVATVYYIVYRRASQLPRNG